jgi:hypothetical protein
LDLFLLATNYFTVLPSSDIILFNAEVSYLH